MEMLSFWLGFVAGFSCATWGALCAWRHALEAEKKDWLKNHCRVCHKVLKDRIVVFGRPPEGCGYCSMDCWDKREEAE